MHTFFKPALITLALSLPLVVTAHAQTQAQPVKSVHSQSIHSQANVQRIKTQDGYISTRLHQNLDPNGKFHLVNVAVWRSAEDFQRATAKMRETMPDNQVEGVKFTPSLFKVIKSD